jgi:hypothetical protein
MNPLATLLGDLEPHCLVEIGDDLDASWARPASLSTARIVRLEDRAGLADDPERLASEFDALDTPVEVFVDHATDDVGATLRVLEVLLGRLIAGGVYVVHGLLPTDVVLDLMFASVVSPELIDGVSLESSMVAIHRGSAHPRSARVTLAQIRSDPFGVIPR